MAARARGGYRLLHPGTQVDLVFDVVVTPETRADLVLGGLARGPEAARAGDAARSPARAGRSYDRLYWLEAIGTVLMAPLAARGRRDVSAPGT